MLSIRAKGSNLETHILPISLTELISIETLFSSHFRHKVHPNSMQLSTTKRNRMVSEHLLVLYIEINVLGLGLSIKIINLL